MNRKAILIVDDLEVNRAILSELFARDFDVLEAENGQEAVQQIEAHEQDIAIMLLDVVMPVLDGYGVMEIMRARGYLTHIPVIIITSLDSHKDEARLFDMGASDLIMKPFNPLAITKRVMNVTEQYQYRNHLEQLVQEQADRLEKSNEAMIDTLGAIIEYRSMETGQHIARIRGLTKLLLQQVARECPEYELTEKKIHVISSASAMHDIGKIVIPDAVLNKPGRLTPAEFDIIKTHTTSGSEILERFDRAHREDYFIYAITICRHHHERWDGRGYPDGLKGDEIPVCAHTVGVADCYDALTTNRVYKPALPHETAVNMIVNGECGSFSPKIIQCFLDISPEIAKLAKLYADDESAARQFS